MGTEKQLGGFMKLVFVGTDGVAVLGTTDSKRSKRDYMFVCYNQTTRDQKNPIDRIVKPKKDEASPFRYKDLTCTSFMAFPEIDGMRMVRRYHDQAYCSVNYLKLAPPEY